MTSTSSPRFYQQLAVLDRERHANLKLSQPTDLSFAANLQLVPLVTTEFVDVAREYPIVFLRDETQTLVAVALTGAPHGKNLYVGDDGRWNARYVPAFVRRHPFAFAKTAPDQLTVCIDEAGRCFGDDGAPLFASGEPTPMLQQIIARLSEYERQTQVTLQFTQRLEASGILIEADARADLGGDSLALQGFLVVDEARLRALPEAVVKEWFTSGELGLIYAHLISLGNLLELLRRQTRGASAT